MISVVQWLPQMRGRGVPHGAGVPGAAAFPSDPRVLARLQHYLTQAVRCTDPPPVRRPWRSEVEARPRRGS